MTTTFKLQDSKRYSNTLTRARAGGENCFPARRTCKTSLGGTSCRRYRYTCRRKRALFVWIALEVDEDAFGNLLNMEASEAATALLYSGEFTDAATGQQYLRARFYDPTTGRFNRLDDFAGDPETPQSLHKYVYGHADPVQNIDPTGMFSVVGLSTSIGISSMLSSASSSLLAPVLSNIASSLIPSSLLNRLSSAGLYDAVTVGASFGVNQSFGAAPAGLSAGVGTELLWSPHTGEAALYWYPSVA